MAVFRTKIRSDLQKPLVVQQLSGNMFTADNASNEIAVEVTNGGEPVALSGAVTAYAVRADGVTAMFSGTISGNVASVVLPASCYVEVGTLSIVIKVGTTTVGACTCYVYRTTTDEIVDPGHVIPSIDELLEQIEACRTATTNANTATANANTAASNANAKATLADEKATLADQKATLANTAAQNADTKAGLADTAATNANTKAGLANDAATLANTKAALADEKANLADAKATLADTAATNANTKAGLADTAAQNADEKATLANNAATLANTKAGLADTAATNANTAAGKIDNMTVAATGLPEGSAPIATISEVDGHKHVLFQIPKGDKGKDFHIAFTFASIAAMEAYSGDIDLYDYAMIDTGNVQDADTGKLYCYEQDEEWHYIGDLSGAQGIKGETGTGIDHVTLNNDYTLTIYYDDGTQFTTTSIRGATGITPNIAVGTVTTLLPDQQAYVTRDPSSTAENPVFNFGIPKGDTGAVDNVYGTTVPMSESDSTTVADAIRSKLDKNQGTSNAGKFMKVGANGELTPENVPDPTNKADKVTNATAGNFAGLDTTGNLTDSGKSAEDFAGAIYKTATPGSIVTIEDGADDLPIKELKVAIEPVQDLHGYDYPWPAGGGKNLIDYLTCSGVGPRDGTEYDEYPDKHSVSGSILTISIAYAQNGSVLKGVHYPKLDNGQSVTISGKFKCTGSEIVLGVARYTGGTGNQIDTRISVTPNTWVSVSRTFTLTEAFDQSAVFVQPQAVNTILEIENLQLELGSTATTYSPYSNICPISGWDSAKVSRTGKNLCVKTIKGFPNQANQTIRIDNDSESVVFYAKKGTTYTVSHGSVENNRNTISLVGTSDIVNGTPYTQLIVLSSNSISTWEAVWDGWTVWYRKASADADLEASAQVEVGSTATAYEPYQGETYDITFPSEAGTVYGGTLDVKNGKLALTHGVKVLDGSVTYYWSGNNELVQIAVPNGIVTNGVTQHNVYTKNSMFIDMSWAARRSHDGSLGMFYGSSALYVKYSKITSVADAVAFFTENPTTVVYELATPITYQLTSQEIRTLLGVNNIWADTGDITELIYPVNTDTAMALYEKADKVANATAGNFAALDAEGNITDSGKKPGDFLTQNQGSANAGKFMKVGADGNLVPDAVPDPTGKADKVSGATNGNFAGLDANGNLTDSDKSAEDFLGKEYETELIHLVAKEWGGLSSFNGQTIWTDGENIYYSSYSNQYVLDKSTYTWYKKTWNGLSDFTGDGIWTDGENIYYSSGTQQYILDKSASTWNAKTWSGFTNLFGNNVWTDGENIYYSSNNDQYVLDKSTSTWESKTWSGLSNYYGSYVWTDGENIYYSNGTQQYILDKSTYTWNAKTWSGLESFTASAIWTDGENYYYSNTSKQYVLDKTNSTWSEKTWNGIASFTGGYVWSDGENVYYSQNYEQYVLNKSTSTWNKKEWNGIDSLSGNVVWTDGNDIYYSNGSKIQYVFDKSDLTWKVKTWNGYDEILGFRIWTDGENIYYSNFSSHYVLDKSTSTWYKKTWNGLTVFFGSNVWTDGENIYYSNGTQQYILDKSTSTWNAKTWSGFTNLFGNNVWTDGENIYYSSNNDQYVLDKSTSTWESKTWSGLSNYYGSYVWTDGENIYYSNGTQQYILDKSTSTWNIKEWGGLSNFNGDYIWNYGKKYYYSESYSQYEICDNNTIILGANGVFEPVPVKKFIDENVPAPDLSGKVDKNQGTENAGKALGINNQGQVVPVPFSGEDFTGATPASAGTHGYVPAPQITDMTKFLCGDGTWADVAGGKLVTFELDEVTGTGGAYGHITYISSVTHDMKAVLIEVSDPEVFLDEISISCMDGGIALSCNNVNGTSTVTVSCLFKANPDNMTSSEFDVLSNRIGTLGNLKTTAKSNLVGAVNELYDDIAETKEDLEQTQDGLGIGADGNTHEAVSSGQFVYVRNHETLPDGLYNATAAISANGALSTSNLTPDGSGGLNALKGDIDTLSSKTTIHKLTLNKTASETNYIGTGINPNYYIALSAYEFTGGQGVACMLGRTSSSIFVYLYQANGDPYTGAATLVVHYVDAQ